MKKFLERKEQPKNLPERDGVNYTNARKKKVPERLSSLRPSASLRSGSFRHENTPAKEQRRLGMIRRLSYNAVSSA
jgi:hypothetical protein